MMCLLLVTGRKPAGSQPSVTPLPACSYSSGAGVAWAASLPQPAPVCAHRLPVPFSTRFHPSTITGCGVAKKPASSCWAIQRLRPRLSTKSPRTCLGHTLYTSPKDHLLEQLRAQKVLPLPLTCLLFLRERLLASSLCPSL